MESFATIVNDFYCSKALHLRCLCQVVEPTDPAPTAADRIQTDQVGQRVNQALDALPARQREAIVLCHYQGLSNVEAARLLGVSVEALESLLARGRRSLRKALAPEAGDLLVASGSGGLL